MKLLPKILSIVFIALISLVGISYYSATSNLKALNDQERKHLPGQFLKTRDGILSYTRDGNKEHPVVILVHGFSTPKFVWDQSVSTLVAAGYQVIRFDHFGRGFSERLTRPYDGASYRREILDLLDGLNLKDPVTLVGYSMGGANVVDFVDKHQERVKALILIAPAIAMSVGSERQLANIPLISKILFRSFSTPLMKSSLLKGVEEKGAPQSLVDQYDAQSVYTGYSDALLSTLQHEDVWDMGQQLERLGKSHLPVAVLWGIDDKVVPHEGLAIVESLLPQLQAQSVEGGQHSITYTQPDITNSFLLSALARNKERSESTKP